MTISTESHARHCSAALRGKARHWQDGVGCSYDRRDPENGRCYSTGNRTPVSIR
ncbi:hypothetical protein [uncultured Parabacteroides sp.]|uniref:hypothetical protein n=1 Tax=uncultured Parabacteroides sp. TaxID=512312 RepID=UPI00259A1500|nr:hypothetical protein [uncultured Parabacteroides sp.]